jgi:hypothetical protein
MKYYQYGRLILPLLLAVQFSMAQKTIRVAKDGSAAFNSIQSAIDQAEPGDIIQIEDLSIYEEQITIDSTKSGLILKSKNPSSLKKPVIRWQDTKNQLPKNYNQSQFLDSINYYKNGALRVLRARNVTRATSAYNNALICQSMPKNWCGLPLKTKYQMFLRLEH